VEKCDEVSLNFNQVIQQGYEYALQIKSDMNEKLPHILFITPFLSPAHGSAMVSQQIRDSELIIL